MIFLFSDILFRAGGIETYLHTLSIHLREKKISFRVAVAELEPCPLVDDLVARGIDVYRQRKVPGDRWLLRQRVLKMWLVSKLKPGDWVFCVRQPMAKLYLGLVRGVHRRSARLAASWALSPEFLGPQTKAVCQAVAETDAVISVAKCTTDQFESFYGYAGKVHVVPYHNFLFFNEMVPSPPGPPWKIGYLGRLERKQKNLDQLLAAFLELARKRPDVQLHLHGSGPDQGVLERMVSEKTFADRVFFHGAYDHRNDLPSIMGRCHFFVYPSRFEGGPCFTLLELMQAGRFCVASRTGGIPDLYENFPGMGTLVEPGDVPGLEAALADAVARTAAGSIDGASVRARYLESFDIASAHRAWLAVIGLESRLPR